MSTTVDLFLSLFLITMLIIVPISVVKVVLKLRRLRKEIKKMYKTIFVPYMREENGRFGGENNGFRLDEKQAEFMESLSFGKGFEFRPRFFRSKTKRRLSKAGLVVGASLLAYILFRLVDSVANWVVVSYF